MLRLTKETLAELTASDLAAVVGGHQWSGCVLASCITTNVQERVVHLTETLDG